MNLSSTFGLAFMCASLGACTTVEPGEPGDHVTLDDGASAQDGGSDADGTGPDSSTASACVPGRCLEGDAGALQCGLWPDGCGGTHDCGGCAEGLTCNVNLCCKPRSKATVCTPGLNCGLNTDGCGGVVDCGQCEFGPCIEGFVEGTDPPVRRMPVCGCTATGPSYCSAGTTTVYCPSGIEPGGTCTLRYNPGTYCCGA